MSSHGKRNPYQCELCLTWRDQRHPAHVIGSPDPHEGRCVNKKCAAHAKGNERGVDKRAAIIASYLRMWANVVTTR